MHGFYLLSRARLASVVGRLACIGVVLAALVGVEASAQLSGTYSVGSGGDYSSIAAAASAVSSYGVSGPVVFEIMDGSYTITSSIYLYQATGMSATNTVTFRPAPGADVTISGSLSYNAIFDIYGGDYYIIDGNSSTNGTVTRNMTLLNNYSSTYCSTIWIRNDADHNTIRNCNLKLNSYYYYSYSSGGAVVMIGGSSSSYGYCDYNVIQNNVIGDPNNTYRGQYGVAIYGSSGSYQSTHNEILDNDIVNWGSGPDYYYSAYAVYIYYSPYTVVTGNKIHQSSGATTGYLYGVYIYDYYGYGANCTVSNNQMYDFKSTGSYQYPYFIYYYGYYQGSGDQFTFTNNMISYSETTGYYIYSYYFYTYSMQGTVVDEHNSMYIDGSWQGYCYGKRIYYPDGNFINRNNILHVGNGGYYYAYYLYAYYGWTNLISDYNLYDIENSTSSHYFAYYYNGSSSGYAYSLNDLRGATGKEQNSFTGSPGFLDADNGDLHVSTCAPSTVEGRGTPSSYVDDDFDGDARDPDFPDIGADEGNFNGNGITVLSPNGGEDITVDYQSDIRVNLNRPLPLDFFISTDGGSSWLPAGSATKDETHAGVNTFTFFTPDFETHKALVKVVSGVNTCESDVSDHVFNLVRPRVYLLTPNGGQRWTASDTNDIQWQSEYLPPIQTVKLEYSIDNGQNWLPVVGSLASTNKPAVNTYHWIVPNTPTTTAKVRVIVNGTDVGDTSNAVFTIIEQPSVTVVTPNGGERLVPGQKLDVNFTSVTTENVKLEYSLDGGATWKEMVHRLPAYVGTYEWTVPQGPTGQGLVRVTNSERPRFSDVSDDYFFILSPDLTVLTPNGGVYDLNEPVTVNWSGEDLTTLKLEYSSNNGLTWSTVATGLDGNSGMYTFTPPAIPTDAGRVRLTDETVTTNSDMNDLPFHIAQEPSLLLFQPSGGETYVMGDQATVSWEAYRVDKVNVEYSLNGGQTWTTVASNVPAVQGSLHWTVPNQATTKGEIRVTEVGRVNPLRATSGWFSIVEPKHPALRVLVPNGGEHFTEGSTITVRWSATDIDGGVTLYYSSDNGATWTKITSNVPATDGGTTGSYQWTLPRVPGDKYRVKVEATPSVSDASDNSFTVERELHPSLTMLYPNGAEAMMGGTQETIRWSAVDVAGDVVLSLSTDNGGTWSEVTRVAATAAQYAWNVPTNVEGDQMLMKVETEDGSVGDQSDNTFTISQPVVPQIVVTNPNRGTEIWMYKDTVTVDWTADNVEQVKIEVSTDGGAHWRTIGDAIAAAQGTFEYVVEDLSPVDINGQMLVRVSDASNPSVSDESDAPFNFRVGINAVPVVTGMASGLQLQGLWPNPMRERTELRWTQPESGMATVRIYGSDGRLARQVPIGMRSTGAQSVEISGVNLTSGSYIVELEVGGQRVTSRLVVVH